MEKTLDELKAELSSINISLTQNDFATQALVALSRIEAYSYASAVKSTRILAHLKGEDEDEARREMVSECDQMAIELLINVLKRGELEK